MSKTVKRTHAFKWINRIICSLFLGTMGILILLGIYKLVLAMRTPPPDIADLKELFSILSPMLSIFVAGIIAGLSYVGGKSHKSEEVTTLELKKETTKQSEVN